MPGRLVSVLQFELPWGREIDSGTLVRWLPIVVGFVAGVVSAYLAFGLFVGAVWSSIHSDWGQVIMLGVSLLALVVPIALAFLAGWLTWRALGFSQNPRDEPNDFNPGP